MAVEEEESIPKKCHSLRLRSIRKRMETERNKNLPKARKPRERPAPLSKYRRRTANARERQRMHEVNVAFERLKATIPHHRLKQIDEKKDTKITTLRCAITYINSLSDLLHDINDGKSVSPEYYFTDAQLGIEVPEAPAKKEKSKKGKKPIKRVGGKKVRTSFQPAAAPKIDTAAAALLLSALPGAKTFNNRRKKVNPSAPFMIDNRPEKKNSRKATAVVQATGTTGAPNVLQALINNGQALRPRPDDLTSLLSSQKPLMIKADGSRPPAAVLALAQAMTGEDLRMLPSPPTVLTPMSSPTSSSLSPSSFASSSDKSFEGGGMADLSDDLSQLTPSLMTSDFQSGLMDSSSIQDFLGVLDH